MDEDERVAAVRQETADLVEWTRHQLDWLREDGYEEIKALLLRTSFSLWYLKPAIALVVITLDRPSAEADISVGPSPEEGTELAFARVVSLYSILAARGIELHDGDGFGADIEETRVSLARLLEALKTCRSVELTGKWVYFPDAVDITRRRRNENLSHIRALGPPFDAVTDRLRTPRNTSDPD